MFFFYTAHVSVYQICIIHQTSLVVPFVHDKKDRTLYAPAARRLHFPLHVLLLSLVTSKCDKLESKGLANSTQQYQD